MTPEQMKMLAYQLEELDLAPCDEAADLIRQMAEQEPVSGAILDPDGGVALIQRGTEDDRIARRGGSRLYAAPPAPQPTRVQMTDEQIGKIYDEWHHISGGSFADLIRAVERHHGIRSEE